MPKSNRSLLDALGSVVFSSFLTVLEIVFATGLEVTKQASKSLRKRGV